MKITYVTALLWTDLWINEKGICFFHVFLTWLLISIAFLLSYPLRGTILKAPILLLLHFSHKTASLMFLIVLLGLSSFFRSLVAQQTTIFFWLRDLVGSTCDFLSVVFATLKYFLLQSRQLFLLQEISFEFRLFHFNLFNCFISYI